MGLFITLVPKVYKKVSVFVELRTFGTIIEFRLVDSLVKGPNVLTTDWNVLKVELTESSKYPISRDKTMADKLMYISNADTQNYPFYKSQLVN